MQQQPVTQFLAKNDRGGEQETQGENSCVCVGGAGYIKISSRTVLFLCQPLHPATFCNVLHFIWLQLLAPYSSCWLCKTPSLWICLHLPHFGYVANKSCAQSVDINFVSLLLAKIAHRQCTEAMRYYYPFHFFFYSYSVGVDEERAKESGRGCQKIYPINCR